MNSRVTPALEGGGQRRRLPLTVVALGDRRPALGDEGALSVTDLENAQNGEAVESLAHR